MEKIDSVVELTKNKFAPDKRIAVFNITHKIDGNYVKLTGESNINEGVDELMDELSKLNLNVKNEIKILPDKNLGNKIYGIINLSVANIRSKPNHPAELATQSLLGTCVNVLKKENGWYLIQTPDQYISWVDDDGIYLVDDDEQKAWKQAAKVFVIEPYTIAYEEANNKSQKISDLVIGDILKNIGSSNGFVKIEFPDGRRGFISNNHVEEYDKWINSTFATQSTIVKTSAHFMGLPYLWGGTSSKGFDCSGFTKTVYYLNGVILPRDASQQVHAGKLVNTSNNFNDLQKGDLLFFGRKARDNKNEKITHVAIYIGDSEYIHSAGRVRINSLDKDSDDFNKYRLKTFIRAKRVIGSYNNGENLIKNNQFYN